MAMVHLLGCEMRRALRRRAVWVLIGMAIAAIVVSGVVAFADASGQTPLQLRAGDPHPAVLADWWVAGTGEGVLLAAAFPLLVGGVLGGATVAGAEWRAGTIATVLIWEPRRLRLHLARTLSSFALATLIAFVLQSLMIAAAAPAILGHGSSDGVDVAWWLSLVAAMGRLALLTGLVAVLGVSLATLGRGTTFALAAAFGWVAVGEGIIRAFKSSLEDVLVGDNLAIALTWAPLEHLSRSAALATVTVLAYVAVVAVGATAAFLRADVVGTA